jgi:hypothetical protein
MSEFFKVANNGQWSLTKSRDEKGHCNNCGSKSCDGQDCKVDHAKVAVDANNKKNEGFKNKIKIAGNGQWRLDKGINTMGGAVNGTPDDSI